MVKQGNKRSCHLASFKPTSKVSKKQALLSYKLAMRTWQNQILWIDYCKAEIAFTSYVNAGWELTSNVTVVKRKTKSRTYYLAQVIKLNRATALRGYHKYSKSFSSEVEVEDNAYDFRKNHGCPRCQEHFDHCEQLFAANDPIEDNNYPIHDVSNLIEKHKERYSVSQKTKKICSYVRKYFDLCILKTSKQKS